MWTQIEWMCTFKEIEWLWAEGERERERERERGNVGDDDGAEVDVCWDVILGSCYGLAVQHLIGIMIQ